MNSRIREIVRKHYDCACSATRSVSEALIKELEAYHDKAMVEAADGALVGRAALDRALGRDVSLDVLPGAQSPGDAVRDYVAGMVDDLRLRRDQMRRQRDVQDIIERNAPEWQHGSDAAKGSGVCTCCGHAFSAPACSMSHAMIAHERGCGGESDDERARR